ncbi:MAG TPA: PilT/PilU family type 4a pilus ATPase [Terrimicrobiaceae bacterium]
MPEVDLIELLTNVVNLGGSDLHLTVDVPPLIRLHGDLTALSTTPIGLDACRNLVLGALTENQRSRLERDWELDFALQVDGVGRFRGNAHYCRGALEATFRHIPHQIPELAALGHRSAITKICELRRGLVLVTGITGSGKSTTLAAMVKHISERLAGVIITIEDPIEFVFSNARSIIKQREVGSDTRSFAEALRHALRQDPDVILVGELRDPETISATVTAAETGHLVLGTLHTIDAPKAIDRIVDAFSPEQQPQIIAQLANALAAIVSQRLLPGESGGRVLASEILVANTAVRATIRDRRWEQMVGLIEIGAKDGMHTFDEVLAELYLGRQIGKETAVANARDTTRFENLLRVQTNKRGLLW